MTGDFCEDVFMHGDLVTAVDLVGTKDRASLIKGEGPLFHHAEPLAAGPALHIPCVEAAPL